MQKYHVLLQWLVRNCYFVCSNLNAHVHNFHLHFSFENRKIQNEKNVHQFHLLFVQCCCAVVWPINRINLVDWSAHGWTPRKTVLHTEPCVTRVTIVGRIYQFGSVIFFLLLFLFIYLFNFCVTFNLVCCRHRWSINESQPILRNLLEKIRFHDAHNFDVVVWWSFGGAWRPFFVCSMYRCQCSSHYISSSFVCCLSISLSISNSLLSVRQFIVACWILNLISLSLVASCTALV